MSENIQTVLIAGIVSLIVSGIGFLSAWYALKSQIMQNENKIRSEVASKLISLRLEHYPKAFVVTEKIQRRKEPDRIISRNDLNAIGCELYEWKTGIVSLILSAESIDAFFKLRDALEMGHGEKDRYSSEQVERIMDARDNFRKTLRNDIGFLHVQSPQFERQKPPQRTLSN